MWCSCILRLHHNSGTEEFYSVSFYFWHLKNLFLFPSVVPFNMTLKIQTVRLYLDRLSGIGIGVGNSRVALIFILYYESLSNERIFVIVWLKLDNEITGSGGGSIRTAAHYWRLHTMDQPDCHREKMRHTERPLPENRTWHLLALRQGC